MNNRIVYLDILKGFAILSVVGMHINCQMPQAVLFRPALFSMWHVPLFFMLSGFFIKNENLKNVKKFSIAKFKGLYVKGLYYFIPAVLLHNTLVSWEWYKPKHLSGIAYGDYLSLTDNIILFAKNLLLMDREPIVGAMWFIDTLLLAMISYSIIYWSSQKNGFTRTGRWLVGIIILILVIMSNVATSIFSLTITKVNNSITALGLIYLGQQLYQSGAAGLVNKYTFVIAAIVLWQFSILDGVVALNTNIYTTFIQLACITVSAYYTFAFIAKKIENRRIGRVFAYIGEKSFAIMGLHFVGFKFASFFSNSYFGTDFHTFYLTTPGLGTNYMLVTIYFLFGVSTPLIINLFILKIKEAIVGIYKNRNQ